MTTWMNDRTSPLSLRERVALFVDGTAQVVDVIDATFDHIEADDPILRAFMATDREAALDRARSLDRSRAAGEPIGALHGIAVAIKDCIDIAGWISTSGSIVRADHRATETADCVRALEAAGAVVVGKTLMDEWAFGGSTENPHFGRAANPWNVEHTTGGSSGGSAAAVSAGFVPLALGTDTGGSVRLPAALCGVVGYKPTLGRLSLAGIQPLASSYDTLGIFAHHVEDILLTLGVLDGSDGGCDPLEPLDLMSSGLELLYIENMPTIDSSIASAFEVALAQLRAGGVRLQPISLPWLWEIPEHFRPVVLRELAEGHGDVPEAERMRYGAALRESIAAGQRVTDADYAAGLAFRDQVRTEFQRLFRPGRQTILVAPMTARLADPKGISFEDDVIWPDGSCEDYFLVSTRFTLFANVLGAPSLTVPLPTVRGGLPIGLQLVSQPDSDVDLLRTSIEVHRLLGKPGLSPFAKPGRSI